MNRIAMQKIEQPNALTKTSHLNGGEVFVENVIPHLMRWQSEGLKTAILTLINIEGSSPRPIGSQLAINEKGESVGLISGGCVEPALILEGLKCIENKRGRLIRYGKDSDYFDIQLPCGSGIDIFILPIEIHETWLRKINHLLEKREPSIWVLNIIDQHIQLQKTSTTSTHQKSNQYSREDVANNLFEFRKILQPKHRVVVIGKGAVFDYFLQLISAFDYEVIAYSTAFKKNHHLRNIEEIPLPSPNVFNPQYLDSHSSFVILSHEHDWDIPILRRALKRKPNYIAALGSRKTHTKRMSDLRSMLEKDKVDLNCLPEINGPAGLNIGAASPPEIALSILSELVDRLNNPK